MLGLIGRKGASGLGEQFVQRLDLASQFGDGRVSADRAAHLAHGGFDAQHEGVVARRQRRFDRLEAVEIGGEREIRRLAFVARLIGRQTFAQLLACYVERARGLLDDGLGMPPQISGQGVSLGGPHGDGQGGRRDLGQGLEIRKAGAHRRILVPELLAGGGPLLSEGEASDVEGQVPLLVGRQMGEARHRRAVETLIDDLIQAERTALPRPIEICKGDGRRVEIGRQRPVAAARRAVAGGAVLRVERRPSGKIRRPDGRQGCRIGDKQLSGQSMRLTGHDRGILLGGDRSFKRPGLADQPRLSRMDREGCDPFAHLGRELIHLRVFGRAYDLAVLDRSAVVHREIVEKTPCRL